MIEQKEKILVIGATGLLGSNLLYHLLHTNNIVYALYRKKESINKTKSNFSYYTNKDLFNQIEWIEGDILNTDSLKEVFSNIDIIYNCSGYISFNKDDFDILYTTNVIGVRNIVNVALEENIKLVCHVSSIAALGKTIENELIDEETDFIYSDKISPYSLTKFEGEMEVWRGIEEGLNAVIVNPSVIIGPGDWDNGSSSIIKKLHKGMLFYTKGGTGIVSVDDVSEIMIKLVSQKITSERFVVNSENITYLELFSLICDTLNVKQPRLVAGKYLLEIAWRLIYIFSKIFGLKVSLSKYTARSANNISKYSNKKIFTTLNYTFAKPKVFVQTTVNQYLFSESR